jgi:hypothetical protein
VQEAGRKAGFFDSSSSDVRHIAWSWGTVKQLIGEAVVGRFGEPITYEDHAPGHRDPARSTAHAPDGAIHVVPWRRGGPDLPMNVRQDVR